MHNVLYQCKRLLSTMLFLCVSNFQPFLTQDAAEEIRLINEVNVFTQRISAAIEDEKTANAEKFVRELEKR